MTASGARRDVDVVVLGAGPAGSAVARALKRAGVARVLLVDRPVRRSFRIGESAAPGLGPLLRGLGLDDCLEDRGHRPCYGNLSLWGQPQLAAKDFMNGAHGCGWHLDRGSFDAWLQAEAGVAGVELLSPGHLETAQRDGDSWRASLRAGSLDVEVKTRWIVDATGRAAAFATRSGARRHRVDRLIALAMHGQPAENRGFGGFTLIESVEFGWWYAARVPGGTGVVALMTDADLARAANLHAPEIFRQAWATTSEIRRFVSPPREATRPAVFAAGTQFLDRAMGPGWLALGDALMAFDPLSGSGITGALEDAIAAADTIVQQLVEPSSGAAADHGAAYATRANATLQRYLAESHAAYGRERRWAESRFWQRRRSAQIQSNVSHRLAMPSRHDRCTSLRPPLREP